MTSLAVRKVSGRAKLKLVWVGPRVIGEGVLKLERVQVICPGCGQQVEAVAWDGRVKGYCTVARQYVDFLIETQRVPTGKNFTAETRAKNSASMKKHWQDPEYRAKISASLKKRWQDPEYRAKIVGALTGRHFSEETKAKISTALKRRRKAKSN